MKLWLAFVGGTVSVLLVFGLLRSRPTLARNETPRTLSEAGIEIEKQPAASSPDSPTGVSSVGVRQFDESNVAATAALLEQLPESDEQRDRAREFLTKLFENDRASAADFVTALHEPLNLQMAAALASIWARRSPMAAVEWATNLPPSPLRTHALLSLSADWASADPHSAANFLVNSSAADFPTGSDTALMVRSQMLFIVGSRWATENSSGALKSVNQLPNGPDRDLLISGITSTLAESSPVDAATLVSSMTPGREQNNAALTVLLEWACSDPQAAANWLRLFPSGEFRDKSILNLSAILTEQEPDSAKTVLLAWPEPAERARAIRHYLNETLDTDASRGAVLLAGFEDSALFLEETERVGQYWLMQEPTAALQWLFDTGLDEASKLRLLSGSGLTIQSPF
jgi:hypothetical protein